MKAKYDGGPARRRRRRAASLVILYYYIILYYIILYYIILYYIILHYIIILYYYIILERSLQTDFWNMMMSLLSQVKDLDFITETIAVIHDNVLLVGNNTMATRRKKMRILAGGNYNVNLEHDFRKDFNFLTDLESLRDVFYNKNERETISDTENVEEIIRTPAMVEHGENAHNTQTEELDLMEIQRTLLMGEEEVITRTTTPIRTFGEATNGHNSRTEALDEVGEVEQPNSVTTDNNDRLSGRFVSDQVINLSNRVLSEAEISVLSKGLKFVVTPKELDYSQIRIDLENFGRRLRLK